MKEQAIDTIRGERYVAHIYPDFDPMNPREEFDNVGRMISFFDPSYSWGDEQLERYAEQRQNGDDISSREVIRRAYRRYRDAAVFLWIEHSGYDSTLRVVEDGERADGFIYCTHAQVRAEWGADYAKPDAWGVLPLQRAENYLRGEVETASQWASGDVYGIAIEDEDGEEVESVWGFYGLSYAKEEAESMLKAADKRAARKAHDAAMFEAFETMKIEQMMHV